MAARLALIAVCAPLLAQAKPLLSVDTVYATYDVLADIASTAYTKANVDQHLKQVEQPVAEIKAKINEQMKALPPDLMKGIEEAQVKIVQVKAMVMEQVEKAQEPAAKAAATAKDQIESAVPALKGTIGDGAANLALFAVYMAVVLYVTLKMALLVLRITLSIFCFCCCCGCCRGGKKADAEKPTGKAPNGKAKAAAKKK
jgi:type I site-specific restriction endonuclease